MGFRVGLIGLGRMGSEMGMRFLNARFQLIVCDLDQQKARSLVESGAVFTKKPAEVAQNSDVIILSLPTTNAVEEVLFGEKALASAFRPGAVLIDTSTISPITTRVLAEKLRTLGVDMLDAPVSGGSEGARKGILSMMVGGDVEVLEKVKPVLSAIATNITDQLGVPLPSTAQIFQYYRSIAAQGHAQDGNHSLIQALKALAEGIAATSLSRRSYS